MDGKKVVSGLSWQFAERITAQGITFIVSIILARILAPKDYGIVSIVTIFISFANVFVTSGFGNALIQKKDADDLDFSSVFFAQLILSFALYALLFVAAPLLAFFYEEDSALLVSVLRVLGLRLPLSAINNIQSAYVAKHMQFRKFFFATLFGTLVSAVVGIYMAFVGAGVWALVAQYLTNTSIDTLVLLCVVEWHPQRMISIERLKPLMSYGWKLLLTDILNNLLNSARSLVIGLRYSSEDLAFYNKAEQFPSLLVTNINSSIQTVLFPAMANIQANKDDVKKLLRKTIRYGSFIIFPVSYGFMAVAKPIVLLVLTDKWMECVEYIQLFCVAYSFRIISTSLGQGIKAIGRSDIYLKSTSIYKALELISIVATAFISVKAIAVSTLINAVVLVLIQFYYNLKVLDYKVKEFVNDIVPNAALTMVMVIPISLLGNISSDVWMLTIQVALGVAIYVIGAVVFRFEAYSEIKKLIKNERE